MDIIIVDDEKSNRLTASRVLEEEGHYVEIWEDGALALRRFREMHFDLAFLDLRLGDEKGIELLQKIVALRPRMPVVIFTGSGSTATAVLATQLGAFDYLEKPFTADGLRGVCHKAHKSLNSRGDAMRPKEAPPELQHPARHSSPALSFSSKDAQTCRQFDILFRSAATSASICLLGESGTGKSVIAREIHQRSHLRNKTFETVSCPSLSKELLESELFGHVKGSYTGAAKDTWGKVHEADGGTLFLDEIGELPIEIQPKLLRLLQEREYERVGENKVREANIRIICASNRNLKAAVKAGTFREDLYYRLSVINVTIPPLRQRLADLEHFAMVYLEFFASELKREIEGFSESGRSTLLRHSWPGNLRELRNAIERASILADGPRIRAEDLTDPVSLSADEPATDSELPRLGGHYSLEEIEKAHLAEVIRREPSLREAAAVLGIDNATLYRKRKHFGIA